jgi:hypothetical protein
LSGWCESGVCYFSAADVVAKAQAVLSESELLRAMFDVGYLPAQHAERISGQ